MGQSENGYQYFQRSFAEKANARFELVQSAKQAKQNNITQKEWARLPQIQSFIKKYQLKEDLVEHIACFVWTFKK